MFVQVLLWCLLAAVGSGYTSFDPVCTRPVGSVNFVSSPDTRGTMEILWGSLFTLIACTWTIHHPNVPEQRDGRDKGLKGEIRWGLKSAWESAKLALVTVLAPELIISIAWDQHRIAKKVKRELKEKAAEDGVPWTLVHGHFAAMGGFVIRYNTSVKGERERGAETYHLTADDVIFLRKSGHLVQLPNVTRDELCDKSKSDPLLKLIAVCQISWSIIQISTRTIRRLPISLLELNVLALAACAIVIYGLCWYKPKHVQVAMTILTYEGEIPDPVKKGLEEVEMSAAWVILFDTAQELQVIRNTHPPRGAPLSNTRIQFSDEKSGEQEMDSEKSDGEENLGDQEMGNAGRGNERPGDEEMGSGELGDEEETGNEKKDDEKLDSEKLGVAVSLFVAATLFGAVHVAGWNLSFPTRGEQIVWRGASIYILTLPCMIILLYPIGCLLGQILRLKVKTLHSLLGLGGTLLCWVYLFARLFILVETIRTFISLPSNVFIATWTVNIPHFA
ncbi:Paternally-expressed gene 3 protein [Madurella mycetomatis]|uniref:Paternally-expressed gene 3 protein n=1 Tax=Madurella mycetomatis TaxID=100816 RepID=A0A175W7J4_9PEZI|nr:Paternally-expressed gene 3 protein [Madurella mycetomatis]